LSYGAAWLSYAAGTMRRIEGRFVERARRLGWIALAWGVTITGCERVDNLARLEEAVGDKEAYAKRVQSECQAGRAASCTSLGVHYAFGTYGRTRDYGAALQVLTQACTLQDPNGCHELGVLHQYGRGVAPSAVRAAELYERACAGGVSNSCHALSEFYRRGANGILTDEARAAIYASQACSAGYKADCKAAK
jgi:TPR repeat protein